MVNQIFFSTRGCEALKATFPCNCGEINWGLKPGTEHARTETLVQFTDGHDIPRGPIDSHDDPVAPLLGQRWFSNDHC